MRVTALRTIGELVAGRTPGAQAATSKLYASVQHQRLLELATELLAEEATVTGDGYALEPLQRAFLLSRAETIYGGSSQIQRNIIGERVLGLPKEPRPGRDGDGPTGLWERGRPRGGGRRRHQDDVCVDDLVDDPVVTDA